MKPDPGLRPIEAFANGISILIFCFCLLPQALFAFLPEIFGGQAPGLWNPPVPIGVTLAQQSSMIVLVLVAAGVRRKEMLALTRGQGISDIVTSASIVFVVNMPLLISGRPRGGYVFTMVPTPITQ